MKTLKNFLSVILLLMAISLSSCQNEEDVLLIDNSNNRVHLDNLIVNDDTDNDDFLTQQILDSLESTEVYFIDKLDDLLEPMQNAQNAFEQALKRGDFNDYPFASLVQPFSSETRYTQYETIPLGVSGDLHQQMFFKSKFSSSIVNSINANVSSAYKISTGTTYCCYWNIYYHRVKINPGQMWGPYDSPKCALHPDTKESYITRGYSKTQTSNEDGTKTIALTSYELLILYKDTNKETIRLNITYPRVLDPSPWKGYEFIYNIITI